MGITNKKNWILALVIVILLAAVWIFLQPGGLIRSDLVTKQPDLPKIVKVDSKHPEVEARLVEWVYNHSTRTSMRMCKEWVDSALKTNKPLLILALALQESEYNPTAVSNMNAKGGTQVMWKYWGAELIKEGICKEERDLFDIDIAVRAGNLVLDECLRQGGGDIEKALKAYLGGRDGFYKNKITENLANLYVVVTVGKLKEVKEVKKPEHPKVEGSKPPEKKKVAAPVKDLEKDN